VHVKRAWLVICVGLFLIAVLAVWLTSVPNRGWHNALVLSVQDAGWSRYFEVIDSRDPDCILKCSELRNPFKPLSISKGATLRINPRPRGVIYLIDERGRVHNGRIDLIALMATRAAPQK
jgi:hypothetical protein